MAGLYVHIPFCHSKCIYCDFYSTPRREKVSDVVKGLVTELESRKNEVDSKFETVYIGGGTPSIIAPEILKELVDRIDKTKCVEFTIEANPEDITSEIVDSWCRMGVNRVSIGVQSLDDNLLRNLGRRHSGQEALDAIQTLQSGGINNISCDLMYGLPGLDESVWGASLERLLATGITHLSAYCLTYYEGTMLYRMSQRGKMLPPDDDAISLQFNMLREYTKRAGFEHYEISNFAKEGYYSRHNTTYWRPDGRWLGIGPSAHSFDGNVRRVDYADIATWMNHLPNPYEVDEETDMDRYNDYIVTALRTASGLDLALLPDEIRQSLLADAQKFINKDEMQQHGNYLSIKPQYWLISDSFIRELIRL